MKYDLSKGMGKTAEALRFMGKTDEARAIDLFRRLVTACNLTSFSALEEYVLSAEMDSGSTKRNVNAVAKAMVEVVKAAEPVVKFSGERHADWALRNTLHNSLAALRRAEAGE